MDLKFNQQLAKNYRSGPQIIRVLSEAWVKDNGYCPNCSTQPLCEFANNQPVADFYCADCDEQYELKSKKAKLSHVINDGAYDTMIERIKGDDNPSFFFLTYSKELAVDNFLIIPKQFFKPDIIIKRNPLSATARRAGWVGCTIDLRQIPESGKVFLVKNQQAISRKQVTQQFQQTLFLREQSHLARGWTVDVWRCIDRLNNQFTLQQVYTFANELQLKHPENNYIHDKIRQQLQILRDRGIIEFLARGHYQKIG